MKYIVKVHLVAEFEVDSSAFPDGTTQEEIRNIELANISDDPAGYLQGDFASIGVTVAKKEQ